ncbi:MAG: carboxypeptidase-like regulatory domain-containing protein [Bacteroidales bacterium]
MGRQKERTNRNGLGHPAPWILLVLLCLSPTLCAQTPLPESTVSISAKRRSIPQILDDMSLQTGYDFTYNSALISPEERINFTVRDMPLSLALDSLLQDPDLEYRTIGRNIVIVPVRRIPAGPALPSSSLRILGGQVVDARNGKPLEFATLALDRSPLGTITNQNGEFVLKIPASLPQPVLIVSYMGYKSHYLPLPDSLEGDLTIELDRETISLQEVVIRFTDPETIWKQCLERLPENYLDESAAMTAFYRESVRRNASCMMYSEAVLDVAKSPYGSVLESDRVRIRKGRKISDISAEDTVLVKLRSGIHTSLDLDIVKNRPDFLDEDFPYRYDLEFTDIVSYNDRLVYVIGFHQKEHIDDLLFQGSLYIDQQSLAIVAADFEFNPEILREKPEFFLVSGSPRIRIRPLYARYHAEYKPLGDRYHISQVRAEIALKIRRKRDWIGAGYGLSIEMAVTDVHPGQKMDISGPERVRPNSVLADTEFRFDPEFWGIFNTIEPEASLRESIDRIRHNLQEIQP